MKATYRIIEARFYFQHHLENRAAAEKSRVPLSNARESIASPPFRHQTSKWITRMIKTPSTGQYKRF